MIMRRLFVCSALLLFASVACAVGSYQRTRDGKTLFWNASPKPDEEATWSGKRDKHGFATGSGILTSYKVIPTFITGSLLPDTRRYTIVVSRRSGKMVHGKWKGAVTSVDRHGKRLPATFANRRSVDRSPHNRLGPEKKATPAPTPAVTLAPTVEQTPAPVPEEGPSPGAQELLAALTQPTAPDRVSKQPAAQPDAQKPQSYPIPTPAADSLRPLTAPSSPLLKPPPNVDEQTVATFDTVYQKAVAANDAAIMDQILADDFVFVTDRGASLTKADLLKEARDNRTIYEIQEEEEGTQKVRIWRDTAVVTALLRIKGRRDENPFDYEVSVNQIYVRTPTGWRYVFGRASIPLPNSDAK